MIQTFDFILVRIMCLLIQIISFRNNIICIRNFILSFHWLALDLRKYCEVEKIR